jgi:hypothetical protein
VTLDRLPDQDGAFLLLADPSPALRMRVLLELLAAPLDDPEAVDLANRNRSSTEVEQLLAPSKDAPIQDLVWRLCRLAHLGIDAHEPRVAAIAERVFERQSGDGSWPLGAFRRGGRDMAYSMIPLQTALPLRGLAAVGLATDPRAEQGYDWLLARRLEDGAWPLGTASGQPGYIAAYRKLPGSKGCRANTQAAIAALALHPGRRTADATRRALDLLLQRETREEWTLGNEVARLVGREPATGFVTFHARFDLAFVLELASRAGASSEDERVGGLVRFLDGLRGDNGLWQHRAYPELSRWLTFSILSSLRRMERGDWVGAAPRVPFRAATRGRASR